MRVLIIDDDPEAVLLCRVTLEFEGHEVATCDRAGGMVEICREQPDLVLLGATAAAAPALRRLLEVAETWGVPVLVLSSEAAWPAGVPLGSAGFVRKPVGTAALTEAVRRVSWRAPRNGRRAEDVA